MATLDPEHLAGANARLRAAHEEDLEHLARVLGRRGLELEALLSELERFEVAIPTWGVGRGGTRFARFPIPGEPRDLSEKLEDCAVIQQLVRCTPRVSPHFPWDRVEDPAALLREAEGLGLGFDAVNSNTFQDQPGQARSYEYGSLTHTDPEVRAQAVAHNLECIELGQALGSEALTVWIADGANFPGQQDLAGALDRYLESLHQIVAGAPEDWQVFLEHKLYEPALYSTVISDWGTSYLAASELGPKARCLVDLGHHAPTTNIEQVVARLARFGKLGGFHFNDSKYGDDDLDSGSIAPFQLFLVFHELDQAEAWVQKYGDWTFFIFRMLPVVRTFISLPAGVLKANFWPFTILTFLGSWIWSYGLVYAGVYFGENIDYFKHIWHQFDAVILLILFILGCLYIWKHVQHFRNNKIA